MTTLVPLPIILPLFAAAICVIGGRSRNFQRVVSVATLTAMLGISVALLIDVDGNGSVVHKAGGWDAPLGITLIVDRLAALMLVVSAAMLLFVAVYAIGQGGEEARRVGFHPIYLVLASGVAASLTTADLFNLFVAFEMMLVASYVLLTFGGRHAQIRSGMTYVVISLVASMLFVTVVALIYASTGTVNMAQLAERMPELPSGLQAAFGVALLVVFGIKAGLFPLFFWLPDSYPTAPGPITAVFAGLLTKIGVYTIIRTQTLMFPDVEWMGTLLLVVACLTMTIGVFGAIAQDDMKRLLAFHIISQIGYMIFGLGLFSVAGIAGAIFYTVNQIVLKTTLFLVAGLVDRKAGSSRLSEVGGLVRAAPLLAVLFALPALSLAGLPPFGGFIAKFAVAEAGISAGQWAVVAVSLAVSLCTLFSMTKVWAGVFWGEPDEEPERRPAKSGRLGGPVSMVLPTGAAVVVSLLFAVGGGPIYGVADRASCDLMATSHESDELPECDLTDHVDYIEAVLGGGR